jgi:hypothetical protein
MKEHRMDKTRIRIVKVGEDESNEEYWATLTGSERLDLLEELRAEVIKDKYATHKRFQRVYRIVKRP